MGLFDFLKKSEDEEIPKADRLDLDQADPADLPELDDEEREEHFDEKSAPADRAEHGPFDAAEADPAKRYVELGALRVPAGEGLGLRLEVEERSRRLVAVALDYEGSTLQLQAFAAPRSTGLWLPILSQLSQQVSAQGGQVKQSDGPLGPELTVLLPAVQSGQGTAGHRAARFLGVDGPRWFLRGVISGKAITDPAAAASVVALFRSVVVVRGDNPLPPRELLPLVVPKALSERLNAAGAAQAKAQAQAQAQAIAARLQRARPRPADQGE